MAMIIEIHQIKTMGVNSLNRDNMAQTKSVTKGNRLRARISSQSQKRAIEDSLASALQRTKYLPNILLNRYSKDHPGISEEETAVARNVFMAVTDNKVFFGDAKKAGDDGKKQPLVVISDSEIDAIYSYTTEIILDNPDEQARKQNITAILAEADKKEKSDDTKLKNELKKELDERIRKAGLGLALSISGRMAAAGPGYPVPSSTHFNHAYSIDANYRESDYFSAVDTFIRSISESGSGHIDDSSFDANAFYFYMNLDPMQVLVNLSAGYIDDKSLSIEEKRKNLREDAELAKMGVLRYLDMVNKVVPTGKQNSMATYPNASVMLVSFVKDGAPCTMDNMFDALIVNRNGVAVEAAERFMDFRKDVRFHQNYVVDQLLGDTGVMKHLKDKEPSIIPVNRFGEVLEKIGVEIDKIYTEYIESCF